MKISKPALSFKKALDGIFPSKADPISKSLLKISKPINKALDGIVTRNANTISKLKQFFPFNKDLDGIDTDKAIPISKYAKKLSDPLSILSFKKALEGIASGEAIPIFGGIICGPSTNKLIAATIPDEYFFTLALKTVSFAGACGNHDECWDNACSKNEASVCDQIFLNELKLKCDHELGSWIYFQANSRCYDIAQSYYDAVVITRKNKDFPLRDDNPKCPK